MARVGPRDAFLRVTELLDQLQGAGTILLSARESFFELYKISAAIRSYLQPRTGSYDTAVVRLMKWTEIEGRRVFAGLGSIDPEDDLRGLMDTFNQDQSIVLQPFFLTRLAVLWTKGERFAGTSGENDPRWKTEYIIKTYIDRESGQKWIDRDGRPLLTSAGHTTLLAGIAEEMWRSGAFRLTADELRLAAQVALASAGLPAVVLEGVVDRAATHAALTSRVRGFSFLHDRF